MKSLFFAVLPVSLRADSKFLLIKNPIHDFCDTTNVFITKLLALYILITV